MKKYAADSKHRQQKKRKIDEEPQQSTSSTQTDPVLALDCKVTFRFSNPTKCISIYIYICSFILIPTATYFPHNCDDTPTSIQECETASLRHQVELRERELAAMRTELLLRGSSSPIQCARR